MKGSALAEEIDREYRIRQMYKKKKQQSNNKKNEQTSKEETKQS